MTNEIKKQFSQILQHLAESLDIPESSYLKAKEHYEAVGKWLGENSSPLTHFKPDIYPQGSFRLGTVVKPITHKDEYDIDLVCELNFTKNELTQKKLKNLVGNRLKENKDYKRMLDDKEGKRCWTLHYSSDSKFHIDILPAIPDGESFKLLLASKGFTNNWSNLAISITDNTLLNYNNIDNYWPRSNPKGYAEWFKNRMRVRYDELRKSIMEKQKLASIDDVPDYSIKTPLQRAIQILKRHRDVMFEKDQDDKPISIIITTLAAHSYNNEVDIFEALSNIVQNMHKYIEITNEGFRVRNPVNPLENFADKWNEKKSRKKGKFIQWLTQIKKDIENVFEQRGIHNITKTLQPTFGEKVVTEATIRMGESYKEMREKNILTMSFGTGMLGSTGNAKVKDHTFYGS